MQKPKLFKVGDKVRREKAHEDYFWLSETGAEPNAIFTIKQMHERFCTLEEVTGNWALWRFEKVTPVAVTTKLSPEPKAPSDFLRQAADTLDERGKQYDASGSERSMEKTVAIFNMLTGNSLTTAEGWQFMKVLKDVRLWSNTDVAHVDSIVDNLGYTALLAEETISLGGKLKQAKD